MVAHLSEPTTIQVNKKIVAELKTIKDTPRQTYIELLEKMIQAYKQTKKSRQYDAYLHAIQQPAMKALWDNKYDEEWENA